METNDTQVERLMRDGQAAAKRGDKAMARALLTQLLEIESNNEDAWMWLSGVVTEVEEQTTCLENVLAINPNNAQARKGLEHIRAPRNTPENTPVLSEPPSGAQALAPPIGTALLGAEYQAAPDFMQAPQATAALTTDPLGSMSPTTDPLGSMSPTTDPLSFMEGMEGVAPFEAPNGSNGLNVPNGSNNNNIEMPLYTGGPPMQGMPPDMGAAIPDWVHGSPASAVAQNAGAGEIMAPQSAMPQAAMPTHDMPAVAFAGMAASTAIADTQTHASAAPTPNAENDLNAWLDELASSANFKFEEEAQAQANTGTPDVGDISQTSPFPTDPFIGERTPDFAPVGPYTSAPLPALDDLPRDNVNEQGQPWYLSSHPSGFIGTPPEAGSDDAGHNGYAGEVAAAATINATVASLECPYCHHYVPDTSLACPECRFTFFVHCPHCHELVDTSTAITGVIEPCPYCGIDVNKMELGLINAKGVIEPVVSGAKETDKSWTGEGLAKKDRRGWRLNFGWLVDVVWLVIVVLMVWALTQLPTWLHLTGLYN